MMTEWRLAETNTHQDHVIAHVIGATVLGYFVLEETAFLLLDIGFIWHIYLDGEMGLRPHPVAISELEIDQSAKSELQSAVDAILQQRDSPNGSLLQHLPTSSPIQTVEFFVRENSRRLLLSCEEGSIVIETSLETCEVKIMTANDESDILIAAAREEREFVRERLRNDFGREPTEEELNEWLREHTESY